MILNKNQIDSWYLVVSKLQTELTFQGNFLRQSYGIYLPPHTQRVGAMVKISNIPKLFPRYIYVIHHDKDGHQFAKRNDRCARFGGMPAAVPESMITNLKNNENEFSLQSIEKKELKQGDKVEIIDGSFDCDKAIHKKMKTTERASVY